MRETPTPSNKTRTGRRTKVALAICNGVYRIRFTHGGKNHVIYPGLNANDGNAVQAEYIRSLVELDLSKGEFDNTLNRYKVRSPVKDLVIQTQKIGLTALEIWTAYTTKKIEGGSKAPTTIVEYGQMEARLKAFPLEDFPTFDHWWSAIAQAKGHKAVWRTAKHLNSACQWALRKGLIQDCPVPADWREDRVKEQSPPPIAFTADERDRILAHLYMKADYVEVGQFVEFLFLTGCRPCEAVGLIWGQIEQDFSSIYFDRSIVPAKGVWHRRDTTKTKRARIFPCNTRLQRLLQRIKTSATKNSDPVLLVPECLCELGATDYQRLSKKYFIPTLERLNLDTKRGQKITLYNCRDTFISLQCASGQSPLIISKWVGNSVAIIEAKYFDSRAMNKVLPIE
jgi:integrase